MASKAFEDRVTDPTGMTVRDEDGVLLIDGRKVERDDVQTKVPRPKLQPVSRRRRRRAESDGNV